MSLKLFGITDDDVLTRKTPHPIPGDFTLARTY